MTAESVVFRSTRKPSELSRISSSRIVMVAHSGPELAGPERAGSKVNSTVVCSKSLPPDNVGAKCGINKFFKCYIKSPCRLL